MLKWSLVVFMFFSSLVWAQNLYEKGNKYIGFEINRNPEIRGGYFWDDEVAFVGGIILNFNRQLEANGVRFRFGIDRYAPFNQLTSYWGGSLSVGINPVAYSGSNYKGTQIILDGHWGLNLFIFNTLSLTGQVGLALQFDSPQKARTTLSFHTFSSGLMMHFFF
ncbi:MAG: hypothetical protein D6732_24665 [Methanobacteriota archaeon]|nr:MAG: hypothetical protein D6732_24665 [Euryarchaeota archaeon]